MTWSVTFLPYPQDLVESALRTQIVLGSCLGPGVRVEHSFWHLFEHQCTLEGILGTDSG